MTLLALLWLTVEAFARPRVVVVQSDDLGPYTDPVPAFLAAIGEPALVVNLHGRRSEADALSERLRREQAPRVVFCLGAKAAFAVREALPSVPIVYTAVVEPDRYGIGDARSWGIAATADPITFLSQAQAFFPEVKKIGWIRGPSVSEFRVAELRGAAEAVGVELVIEPATGAKQVRKVLDALAPRVDAVWVPPDRDVLTAETFRMLTDESRRRKLPLLVPTDNMVRAGGLFAVVPDAAGVGQDAARAAIAILEDRSPGDHVTYPEQLRVALNLQTLELAQIPFDKLMLDFVDVPVR